jgi:hypothetical protein
MSTELVFFLHRLGLKVYQVKSDSTVVELADVSSLDIAEITKKLESFSGSTVRLLTSDSISYLFQSHIDITNTPLSRDIVFQKIKSEIPEDVESIRWDYKVVTRSTDFADVVVFAPVADFQKLIDNVSRQLRLVVEAIEPESISSTRHPNPIVGITLKNDIGEKDESTLNISTTPTTNSSPSFPFLKIILSIIGIVAFVLINYFLYQKYNQNQTTVPTTPSPTPTMTTVITPTTTPLPTKKFSDLSLLVQNGTPRSGYAGSIAAKFKENGVSNVTSANADRDDYSTSQLSFASDELKNIHLSKFTAIFPIASSSVKVDKSQSVDAILILGIN